MNIKEELLKTAQLLREDSAKDELANILSKAPKSTKTASAEDESKLKVALELANDMIDKGLSSERKYRQLVNEFSAMPLEKLASFRTSIDEGLFDFVESDDDNVSLIDQSNSGGFSSDAISDWMDKYEH